MSGITVWHQLDSALYPGDRFAWLLRGPRGGLVLCPNRRGGWAARQWNLRTAPPDERAEPDWLAAVVCWFLAVPGCEAVPDPAALLATNILAIEMVQALELEVRA